MSISRRQFVAGSAMVAASTAIPASEALSIEAEPVVLPAEIKPIVWRNEIHMMLDVMERQIEKIHAELDDSAAEPVQSAHAVHMEVHVLHHRAHRLAERAELVRKLALGQNLAAQSIARERRRMAQQDAGYRARTRLDLLKRYGDLIARKDCTPCQQRLYAMTIARHSRVLECDLEHLLKLAIGGAQKADVCVPRTRSAQGPV